MIIRWIFCMFFLCNTLMAKRNDIAIDLHLQSWVSQENFRMTIDSSFRYSRCCNVYLNGTTAGVITLFKQFIETYPYEYVINKETYSCQGYFILVSTSNGSRGILQSLPSEISTTELLIVVDSDLEENAIIFNTSLYKNANAKVISPSGIWSLSENYLSPREFVKTERYQSLIRRKGTHHFNFKGRRLQAAAFYNPPLCYLKQTVNKTIDGIEAEYFVTDNELQTDGIEMRIFILMSEKLNFTWSVRKPSKGYKYGRLMNGSTWVGGMIEQIITGEVDIAFSSIWLKEDHNIFVNLSEPWYELFLTFLVPRPRRYTSFWALTRPFSPYVWAAIVSLLLLQAAYMYLTAWINPKFPKRFRNFVVTLTELMGRLVGTWVSRNTTEVKIQLQIWHVAGLLVVTAYSSSLAARLASSEYETRIDNVQQFIEANLTWGREGKAPIYHDYFDLNDVYSSHLPEKFILEKSEDDRHQRILNGNYAIIGRIVGTLFFPETGVRNEDLRGYRVMKQTVGNYYACFAVQPWLLKPINKVMMRIKEAGISLFHLRDVIRRRAGLNLREVLVEHDKSDGIVRVLALTPLGAGFSLLIVGLILSAVVFYFELRSISGKKSFREILRIIEMKRKIEKSTRITRILISDFDRTRRSYSTMDLEG